MKRILIATLLGSVAITGSTFAQTAPTANDPATPTERMNPAAATDTAPATGMTAAGDQAEMQSEGGFFTYQEGNQMLGSGLMGADVRGAEGESIGNVEDLVLDRDGQVMAVVVGVGGFLGLGEKDVAIANDQLEFVLAQETGGSTANTVTTSPTGTATVPAAGTAAGGTTAGTATTPAGTTTPVGDNGTVSLTDTSAMGTASGAMTGVGATGAGMTGGSTSGWGWSGAGIDHVQVDFTREQLEGAPAFEYAD